MATDDVGIRLSVKDRVKAARELQAARGDIEGLGDEAERSASRAERSSGRWRKVGLAVGTVAATAVLALGSFAVTAWEEVDNGVDAIRAGTGATGEALADLEQSMGDVAGKVTQPISAVGQALADLNTRTGQTGKPLEDLTKQILDLERVTGETAATTIPAVTRVFGDWGVAADDQSAALDALYRASQATGIGVAELADSMVQFGAPMRELGFEMDETAALLGKFEKEGVNAGLVMGGLKQGLGRLAKAGKDPRKELFGLMTDIENAGLTAKNQERVFEMFGARAGIDMAKAIEEGRFAVGDLIDTVANGEDTISKAAADTADFGEKWAMVKNRAQLALAPLGGKLMDTAAAALDRLPDILEDVGAAFDTARDAVTTVTDWFDRLGDTVNDVTGWMEDHRGGLTTTAAVMGTVMLPSLISLIGQLAASTATWAVNTAATAANTVANIGSAAVKKKNIVLGWAVVAFTNAMTVASWAQTGATKVWAAGQWLLNAALTANPIGLVVVAIAALVAGFVIAYQKSETFRRVVDTVWNALKTGATTAINFVIGMINKLIDGFNAAIRLANKLPFVNIPEIGHIPTISTTSGGNAGGVGMAHDSYAQGGRVTGTGTILVGERGPELLHLGVRAAPAWVSEAATSRKVMTGGDGASMPAPPPVTINVYQQPGEDVEAFAERVARKVLDRRARLQPAGN